VITKFLGNFGYAFVNINPVPKLNKTNHTVFINFVVKPGQRVYVRRINFTSNTKTADNVLRREMRQMEAGLFSLSDLDESKRRLNNLGYLKDVHPELKPVPGQPDKVDLQYHVTEQSSAAASLQFGYSDLEGFIYGASINDRNFMGSGKTVGVQFNRSHYSQTYNLHYFNPYYTKNNISLATNIYYQKTKLYNLDNASDYAMDNAGTSFTYGIPVSEHSRINLGYGYEHARVLSGSKAANEIKSFITKHGNIFDNVTVNSGWEYSNLDRAIFPTKGFIQQIGGEAGLPVMKRNLEYYKVDYTATAYHPASKYFVVDAHGYLGYGNGYGKMNGLPFFENYFAGGIGSVRGYAGQSLGPQDSKGDSIGGNVSIYGSLGLVIPSPMDSIRPTFFVDAGNVYAKQLNLGQLRYSAGIQVEWFTPFAPLVFSLAAPIHKRSGDDTELFQFQMGLSF
jgi:outer membrane protein insertion porin family